MKKFILVIFAIATIIFSNLISIVDANKNPITILLNNDTIIPNGIILNGKTYVPMRAVSEALGANVSWNDKTRTAHINVLSHEEKVIELIKQYSPMVVGIIGRGSTSASSFGQDIMHGSGFIINSNGEILTNAHVVGGMEKIIVVLNNESGYEGKLKYIDTESDLAVIKIPQSNLPVVKLGQNKDIVTGKSVVTIGTPVSFSLRNSATSGIVSGLNRGIDSTYKLVQTDAPINGGNSGGPLITLSGLVIGVNSMKFSGQNIEGMGFAIPVDTVKYVLSHFEKFGKVRRPTLNAELSEDWISKIGLQNSSGLEVVSIVKNAAANKAGIKLGDFLLSINDKKVNSLVDVNEELKNYLPGNEVVVKIGRGKEKLTLKVQLDEKI